MDFIKRKSKRTKLVRSKRGTYIKSEVPVDILVPEELSTQDSSEFFPASAVIERLGRAVEVGRAWHRDWWHIKDTPLYDAIVVEPDYANSDNMVYCLNGVWYISHAYWEHGTTLGYFPLSNMYKYWNKEINEAELLRACEQKIIL